MPFVEALDLVRQRKVHVTNGYCLVPDTEMVTLVAWIFKSLLSQALLVTKNMLPQLNADERMVQVLSDFQNTNTENDFKVCDKMTVIKPIRFQLSCVTGREWRRRGG